MRKIHVNLGNQKQTDDDDVDGEEILLNKSQDSTASSRRFSMISNPKKIRSAYNPIVNENLPEPIEASEFHMDDDLNDMLQSLNNTPDTSIYEGSEYDSGDDDEIEDEYVLPQQTEEEKKKELLRRLYYMQQNGEKIPKRCTLNTAIDDIEMTYGNVMHARKARTSMKFYKQIYYFLTWGIEKAATTFGKGKIRLKEWSEGVAANMDSYDPIFEEIYYTHEDILGGMDPLLKLAILTIASAAVYHINAPEEQTDEEAVTSLLDRMETNPHLMNMFVNKFKEHIYAAPNYQEQAPPELQPYVVAPPAPTRVFTPVSRPTTPVTPVATAASYPIRKPTPVAVPTAPEPLNLPMPVFDDEPDPLSSILPSSDHPDRLGLSASSIGTDFGSEFSLSELSFTPPTMKVTIDAKNWDDKKKSSGKKTKVNKKDDGIVTL